MEYSSLSFSMAQENIHTCTTQQNKKIDIHILSHTYYARDNKKKDTRTYTTDYKKKDIHILLHTYTTDSKKKDTHTYTTDN